jgi:hypothetical protein
MGSLRKSKKDARPTSAAQEILEDKRLWAKLQRALADRRAGRKIPLRDYLKDPG